MSRSNQEILDDFKKTTTNSEVEWLKIELLLDIRALLSNIYGGQVSISEVQKDFADESHKFMNGLVTWADGELVPSDIVNNSSQVREITIVDDEPDPLGARIIAVSRICSSCGRVNEKPARACSGCGTPFQSITPAPASTTGQAIPEPIK